MLHDFRIKVFLVFPCFLYFSTRLSRLTYYIRNLINGYERVNSHLELEKIELVVFNQRFIMICVRIFTKNIHIVARKTSTRMFLKTYIQ